MVALCSRLFHRWALAGPVALTRIRSVCLAVTEVAEVCFFCECIIDVSCFQ